MSPTTALAATFVVDTDKDSCSDFLQEGVWLPGQPLLRPKIAGGGEKEVLKRSAAVLTLRGAIVAAEGNPAPDTIEFNLTFPATITLNCPLPTITESLAIAGPGPDNLTVNVDDPVAFNTSQIFDISSRPKISSAYSISSLTLNGSLVRDNVDILRGIRATGNTFDNLTVGDILFTELGGENNNPRIYNKGGGIHCEFMTLTVKQSAFYKNKMSTAGAEGVAIYSLSSSALQIYAASFENNLSGTGATVVAFNTEDNNDSYIRASSFTHNTTLGQTSALFLRPKGTFLIENSTFSGNMSRVSGTGAIHIQNSRPPSPLSFVKFRNVTISDNTDVGIRATNIDFDSYNSIVANHKSPFYPYSVRDCDLHSGASASASGEYNIESSNSCNFNPASNTNRQFTDPKLSPPAVNGTCTDSTPGGCTLTQAPITPGSPPVGSGDDNTCAYADQRGFVRTSPCDIGAYEFF